MEEKKDTLSNVFRVNRHDDVVEISFGTCDLTQIGKEDVISPSSVQELAEVHFNVDLIRALVSRLLEAGIRYEQESGKSIGFDTQNKPMDKEEEHHG